jgi:chromosome segregation ATPase
LASAEDQNAELSELVLSLEADQEKLMSHHNVLKATIDELHRDLTSERQHAHDAASRVRSLETTLSQLEGEKVRASERCSELKAELATLAAAVKEARDHASAESSARFSADEARSKLQSESEELKARLETLEHTSAAAVAAAKEEAHQERGCSAEMEARAHELLDMLKDRDAELDEHKRGLEDRDEKLQRMLDEGRKRNAAANAQARQLEQTKGKLADAVSELDKKFKQLHDVAGDIADLGAKLKTVDAATFAGFQLNANPRSQLKSLARGADALGSARAAELAAKTTLKNTIEEQRRKLDVADSNNAELRSRLDDLQQELLRAQKRASDAESSRIASETQAQSADDARRALAEQQRANEDLRFRLTELQVAGQSEKSVSASQAKQIEMMAAESAACRASLSDAEGNVAALRDEVAKVKRREAKAIAVAKTAEDTATGQKAQIARLEAALQTSSNQLAKLRRRSGSPARGQPALSAKDPNSCASSIEVEVKRFVARHGAPCDVPLSDSLNHVSATMFAEAKELATVRREMQQERDRALFLEAELSAIRSTSPGSHASPQSGGRCTMPAPLNFSPVGALDKLKPSLTA